MFKAAGLRVIALNSQTRRGEQVTVAGGVANISPLVSCTVLVTIFWNKLVHLPRKMVIAHGSKSASLRANHSIPCQQMNRKVKLRQSRNGVRAMSFSCKTIKPFMKIDERRLEQDWHNKKSIDDTYVKSKHKIIGILVEFRSIWDGHLGRSNFAKDRNELSPSDITCNHSAPY